MVYRLLFLVVLLLIGSVTPIHEFMRTGINTNYTIQTEQELVIFEPENVIMGAPNFSSDISDNYFYRYLSR